MEMTLATADSLAQLAIRAKFRYHVLAQKSFQHAWKKFLLSRIDYSSSVIWIPKKLHLPVGQEEQNFLVQ